MILHKYVDERGIDIIRNLRLLASDPASFNDPFEFLHGIPEFTGSDIEKLVKNDEFFDSFYSASNEKRPKEQLKQDIINNSGYFQKKFPKWFSASLLKEKKDFLKITRILCFSNPLFIKRSDELLMWSHYAASHKGMRITFETDIFDIKSQDLFEIKYNNDMPVLNIQKPGSWEKHTTKG